jgi:hypothetical protein
MIPMSRETVKAIFDKFPESLPGLVFFASAGYNEQEIHWGTNAGEEDKSHAGLYSGQAGN